MLLLVHSVGVVIFKLTRVVAKLKIQWGTLQRKIFIDKIWMLQRTRRNTVGRRSARARDVSGIPALIRAPVVIFVNVYKVQLSV